MKVQGINSSARKTRQKIKTVFAEMMGEKKSLSQLSVTELVKRADITRSTFYTHYDDIYDVAKDYETEIIDLLIGNGKNLYSKEAILDYFNNIITAFKENEKIYRLLLSSDETLYFLQKLEKLASKKIYLTLQNIYPYHPYLDLDVNFFMDGITVSFFQYFKKQSKYSLDELAKNIEKWFEKIFEE